jgi:uncharacterized protein (TIGR03083 family)
VNITQKDVAEGIRAEREALVAYLEDLPEAAWDKPSACDGWTVRDMVAHLIGNAKDVAEQNVEGAGSPEYNQRQVDERAGRSPAELLEEWAVQGPLLEQGILALDDDFWNAPYLELGTVGEAVQRLLEDIWVHAMDIRLPLGEEATTGPGLDATFDTMARELKIRCPRLAPDVGKVAIEADGYSRSVTIGDGSGHVKVAGDPVTLALVGTGRISLERAADDSVITVEPSIPAGFADAFNIYGP